MRVQSKTRHFRVLRQPLQHLYRLEFGSQEGSSADFQPELTPTGAEITYHHLLIKQVANTLK